MEMKNVIEAIEKRLCELKNDIYFKDLEITSLKEKLADAEKALLKAESDAQALNDELSELKAQND